MGQQTMQANKPVFLLMFKMILGFSYFLFIYLSILHKTLLSKFELLVPFLYLSIKILK